MDLDVWGLFKIVKNEKYWGILETTPIPLVSVDVNASVVHTVAQVEVTQVYINQEQQAIEAIYYFPVNPEGAVTHFEAELNGKKIKGTVKSCEEAEKDYEEAVEKQATAFLGEETKPDIFKIRVGFLKPGSTAKLVIGYVTEVKNEPGTNAIRFYIPTTIAPRYVSTSETDKKAKDISAMTFSTTSPAPLSIKVAVSLQGKIKSITSPTHTVKVGMTGPIPGKTSWEKAIVELATETTDMDRDFVLNILPEDIHRARLYSETLADGSTAMMMHLIPSFKLQEQKIEAIFVLDRSGSMGGNKINLARDGLLIFLHSLPPDCYFNVVGFGSTHKFLFDCSVKYDDSRLKEALAYAKSMAANMGGTEIYYPLEKLYAKPCVKGYSRQIFVLTDGQISNTDAVLRIVHKNSGNSRLFSIGIGEAASHYLVDGIAKAGGGTSAFVTTDEGISKKVLHQLKIGLQQSLTGIEIDWDGSNAPESFDRKKVAEKKVKTFLGFNNSNEAAETSAHTAKLQFLNQSPRQIPPVFNGCQLLVFRIFKNSIPNSVTIKAESPDGPLMVKLEYGSENDVGSTGMVHKLAAIKIVRELEEELRQLKRKHFSEESDGLRKKIVEIGCEHGITSEFTSFVAIDEDAGERTENVFVERRQVASQFRDSSTSVFRKKCGRSFGDQDRCGGYLIHIDPRYTICEVVDQSGLDQWEPHFDTRNNSVFDSHGSLTSWRFTDGCSTSASLANAALDTSNESRFVSYGSLASCGFTDGGSTSRANFALDRSNPSVCEADKGYSDELVRFINLQSFDGSFNLDDNFCQVFEKDLGILRLTAKKNGLQNMELATAIAVATFTTRFASECDVWGLVVEKAKKWLATRLSMDHTQEVLKLATTLI